MLLILSEPAAGVRAQTTEFVESYDGRQNSLAVYHDRTRVRVLTHARRSDVRHGGTRAEYFRVQSSQRDGLIHFVQKLKPARVIDELKATVWLRARRNGTVLLLRVVFPNQIDPSTGALASAYVRGTRYTAAGKWQQLECTTRDKQIQSVIRQLRDRLNNPRIDIRDSYVDLAVLTAPLQPGTVDFSIDDLRLKPVVAPPEDLRIDPSSAANRVTITGPPVTLRLSRLQVEGRPFFPRMTAYHGESLQRLKQAGFNVIWVPNYKDTKLLTDLRQHHLWAAATPPRAVSESGRVLDARHASVIPFSRQTVPILFWNLGTDIPADARSEVGDWIRQIHGADHKFDRPIMADVVGAERIFSRRVDLLGISRNVLNTGFGFQDLRNWMLDKRKRAGAWSFTWTWVQTEPTPRLAEQRRSGGQTPIVIEPEQIRLLVYSSLAAGCRGLGFRKRSPLDGNAPGSRERELILSQLNLELALLEPWLATGRVETDGQAPVRVPARPSRKNRGRVNGGSQRSVLGGLNTRRRRQKRRTPTTRISPEIEAAIIRSSRGILLLPIWYQRNAQFVPGQMAANDVAIVVSGVDESSPAWEITTTSLKNLNRRRVPGGIEVRLPKFDQTAAVIFTSDQKLLQELRARIARTAKQSAQLSIALTRAKIARVAEVDAQIRKLGFGQPDAEQLLSSARALLGQAEYAARGARYDLAFEKSAGALQLVRILQRADWDRAVRRLSAAVSSPHTLCFQTLPDHWRMIARVGRSGKQGKNLLRSGDFEDIDTMVGEGWQHRQNDVPGVRATAELYPTAQQGRYSLRLVAVPDVGTDPPSHIDQPPVTVVTPPVTVRSGQILHISGWVRVVSPIRGNLNGLMLYDNLLGSDAALRLHKRSEWQRFQLIRTVHRSGPLTLTAQLSGIGEVQLDDLRIVPYNPPVRPRGPKATANGRDSSGAFGFLNRIPGFRRSQPEPNRKPPPAGSTPPRRK